MPNTYSLLCYTREATGREEANNEDIAYSMHLALRLGDDDGAGPIRIFFSITLPEIKLPLFYTTIMTTTGAFNVWGQPVMLTNGGPNYQTQVLLMDIRNLAFPAGPAAAGMASAMALLLGIILMAIAAIQLIFMNKED